MAALSSFPWGAVIVYTFFAIGVIATGIVIGEVWLRWRRPDDGKRRTREAIEDIGHRD